MTDEEEKKILAELNEKYQVLTHEEARNERLKYIIIGHETCNQMILNMVNRGDSLEKIKEYLVKATSVKGKNAMKKVVGLKK